MNINDIDLIEVNEAFAAVVLRFMKEMNLNSTANLNVNGGAIALGHPIGASGCRIIVTLIHEMIKPNVKKGLGTLCIYRGIGITK